MNHKVTLLTILGALVGIMLLSACGPSQTDLDATATNVAADIFATQTAEAPTVTPIPSITTEPTDTPSPEFASGSDIYWVDQMTQDETGNWLPPDDIQEKIVADFIAMDEAQFEIFFGSDPPDLALYEASLPDWYSGEVLDFYQDRRRDDLKEAEWEECSYQVTECSKDGLECKIVYDCSNGTRYNYNFTTGEMTSEFDDQMGPLIAPLRYDIVSGTWKIHKHIRGYIPPEKRTPTPSPSPSPSPIPTVPGTLCDQEMLDLFLLTELDIADDVDLAPFEEWVDCQIGNFVCFNSLMLNVAADDYGINPPEITEQDWKINYGYDGYCRVYPEVELQDFMVLPVYILQLQDELILPDPENFTAGLVIDYTSWLGIDESVQWEGIPLRPLPTNTSGGTPFPSHTPTATDTPQPDPNLTLEVKGMYLQEFISNDWCGGPGMRMGEITLDTLGNIWVAGGCQGLDGLHVFDGLEWISHDGSYMDVAHDLEGQIWAISPFSSAVDVFDGQQWRTIEGNDLGIGGQQILQVEIDSNGRIWIITGTSGVDQVAEIVLQDGQPSAVFSHPEFTITGGQINSLDADNQGRLWASVWTYTSPDIEIESDGLNVFDGETWQLVTDQDVDLQNVVRTTYDDQGTVWVATQCGSVLTYDGTTWTTVVEGDTEPDCDFVDEVWGITLDPQGRLWAWTSYRIRLLKDGSWVVFTHENSDLPEYGIFGLAVDNENRVWIGTSEGVVMATLQ